MQVHPQVGELRPHCCRVRPKNKTIQLKMKTLILWEGQSCITPAQQRTRGQRTPPWGGERWEGGGVAVERGRGEGSLFSRSKPKPGGLEREVSPFKMPG